MKGRDPNQILREDGVDALRRASDSAKPYLQPDNPAILPARKVDGNGGRQEKLPFKLFRDLLGATAGKQWLAHRLLGAGEASVMYGKPGDGKSVFAEDLGLHIAADLTWHDRRVLHGAVLYVALERRLSLSGARRPSASTMALPISRSR